MRVAIILVLLMPTFVHAQQVGAVAKRYNHTDAMIAMRDGVKLYTTIHVPKEKQSPLPIVMMRTPYGVESRGPRALEGYLKDLGEEGYIFVFQDIRGRHKSDGRF